MKNKLSNLLLIVVFLMGVSLLLYPTVSDYYNSLNQSRAIADYSEQISKLNENEHRDILEAARRYNQKLARRPATSFVLTPKELEEYETVLSITEVMSYIEIPAIHCMLPIYHGMEESVLGVGVGHVAGSSLPVGGKSTHCVLSGHRGLPSAKLFTDLDKITEKDIFILRTLDETLTYKVDQIQIVEPDELSALAMIPGKDYCTLVTCTPYGVNTHRLLIRGFRIENQEADTSICVMADAVQIESMFVASFVSAPVFLILLAWVFRKSYKKGENFKHENRE